MQPWDGGASVAAEAATEGQGVFKVCVQGAGGAMPSDKAGTGAARGACRKQGVPRRLAIENGGTGRGRRGGGAAGGRRGGGGGAFVLGGGRVHQLEGRICFLLVLF